MLGPLLYLLYTADLPATADSIIATFTDDTAVLTIHEGQAIADHRLQTHLNKIQLWLKKVACEGKRNEISPSYFYPKKRARIPPST